MKKTKILSLSLPDSLIEDLKSSIPKRELSAWATEVLSAALIKHREKIVEVLSEENIQI